MTIKGIRPLRIGFLNRIDLYTLNFKTWNMGALDLALDARIERWICPLIVCRLAAGRLVEFGRLVDLAGASVGPMHSHGDQSLLSMDDPIRTWDAIIREGGATKREKSLGEGYGELKPIGKSLFSN
ncbi:hypothetical protein ACLBWT_11095 [Paenibacillus sp. D51F]